MRYDTGRPRAVIRLRISQPRTTSLPYGATKRPRLANRRNKVGASGCFDQRLLEQKMLRDHRSHATGATQPRGHDGQVKQGEQEVLHPRDRVGQTSGATQRCLILESARELGIRDAHPLSTRLFGDRRGGPVRGARRAPRGRHHRPTLRPATSPRAARRGVTRNYEPTRHHRLARHRGLAPL